MPTHTLRYTGEVRVSVPEFHVALDPNGTFECPEEHVERFTRRPDFIDLTEADQATPDASPDAAPDSPSEAEEAKTPARRGARQ